MTENKYAVTGWSSARLLEDVELPSGQLCQVQKISMERIIMLGLVDALDSFQAAMAAVREKKAGKGKKAKAAEEVDDNEFMLEVFRDPEKFAGLMQTVDKCVVEIVTQPKLHANPADPKKRQDELIYVDSVDFLDKMALFGRVMEEVGGVEDFRKRSANHLGAVAEKPGHADNSLEASGDSV